MKPLASVVPLLGFALLLAAPAEAAKLPPGSYQQSCHNAYVDSSGGKMKLYAECPDHQGRIQHSGIQFMKCSGDIANQDGELGCVQGASGGQNTRGQNNGQAGGGGRLPAGTWQQSCRDPQLNGTMLTATCLRGSGGSGYSSIDTRACAGGPVGNQNGQLYCEGGQPSNQGNANAAGSSGNQQGTGGEQGNMGGGQQGNTGQGNTGQGNAGNDQGNDSGGQGQGNAAGQGAPNASAGGMPAGSWQRSCRGPHVSESVLTANCQRRDGAYRYSALDLSSCEGGPVGNDNGRLVCESASQGGGNATQGNAPPANAGQDDGGNANAGGAPALPPGSWQQSCTSAKMAGSLLTASCQRSDGGSRFSAVDVGTCPGGRVGNFEGSLACE
jgi:hypothetical protein